MPYWQCLLQFVKLALVSTKISLYKELVILPVGASTFKEAMKMGVEVYHHLKVGYEFPFLSSFFFLAWNDELQAYDCSYCLAILYVLQRGLISAINKYVTLMQCGLMLQVESVIAFMAWIK
ncbi:uncharacterized protein LOC132293334 isoform X1 [Cornus florida]|uniref:uncharacterized protein LOC132293334 isoform X1 n=1 Tax=Cornus florida TaxID=4283 RepID=UPI00289F5820|nr:uncharacterized protein LOC132293334 isoform X1 [Cornus florida]